MILERIREVYAAQQENAKPPKGNPTGSRFGKCCSQSQMLRFPEITKPEPFPIRARMVMEEGKLIEEWWARQIEAAFPNQSGLAQEPFYFSVPLDEEEADRIAEQIRTRRLWGTLLEGFQRPTIREGEDGRVKLRLLSNKKMGFVLDRAARTVYAPTYVDRVIKHPELGLAVVEKKALSNFGFRRVILGQIGYEMRCQLAGMVEATNLPIVLLIYKKDTAHIAEVVYRRGVERLRVDIQKLNGQTETFFPTLAPMNGDEPETIAVADDEWEMASVWTPFDPALAEAIRERVRRVLLAQPGQWHREWGPSFDCPKCLGVGTKTCAYCLKGISKRSKAGKPCGPCGGTGRVSCEWCGGGGVCEETELPKMPCQYCMVIKTCYPFARLEIDEKPHYIVKRTDWFASGLTFTPPEPVAPWGGRRVAPAKPEQVELSGVVS